MMVTDEKIEQAHDFAVDLDHIAQQVHFAASSVTTSPFTRTRPRS